MLQCNKKCAGTADKVFQGFSTKVRCTRWLSAACFRLLVHLHACLCYLEGHQNWESFREEVSTITKIQNRPRLTVIANQRGYTTLLENKKMSCQHAKRTTKRWNA